MKMLYSYHQRFAWRKGLFGGDAVEFDIAKKKLLRELDRTPLFTLIKRVLKG